MKYIIDHTERPVYLQIYRQIRDDIIEGVFPYNTKLPSKRLLAAEIGVSTITIEHAYSLLCDEGYAEARERSGYFVLFRSTDGFASSDAAFVLPKNHKISTSSYPGFSISILSKTMRKVLTDYYDVLLDESPNTGCLELRNAIKQYLLRNRAMHVDVDQIVIVKGLKYDAKEKTYGGAKIYDPTKGMRVNASAKFETPDKLKLRGTILGVGVTLYWTRIKE